MLKWVINKIVGDPAKREVKRLMPLLQEINELEAEMARMNDEVLREMMAEYRAEIAEETAAAREEVAELRQAAMDSIEDERRRLEVNAERAEKALRRLEDDLLEDMMPSVFAAVREASQRTIGLRHYDVQAIGSSLLHQGRVVEMRTGEGKTLVATMPLVLNALTGHGTHLITPNDYLSKVGVQQMGPVYHFLGLSVAVIQSAGLGGVDKASFQYDPAYQANDDRYQNLRPVTRKEAYACDITYGTNNEFGFDYLRDNMVRNLDRKVQRERHYAIIDEVDNILIDEARTPLIISGQAEESSELYYKFAKLVRPLKASSKESVADKEQEPDGDYVVDEKSRVAYLTDQGISNLEKSLGINNIYDPEYAALLPYLDNAVRAHGLFHRDHEYVVQEGEVIIIDEFTGRMMYGRRYSEGLHQAIEAKESVKIQKESFTWASITFQNFFRMYNKLAGMTGTAVTEAEEFGKIYKLEVSALPTNVEFRAMQNELEIKTVKEDGVPIVTYQTPDNRELYYKRTDYPDVVYKTPQAKFKAAVDEIKAKQDEGQPVLVGTVAIETSEYLSKLLKRAGVKHEVLNAKNHEREAEIIAQAGRLGAVTIATNMAGRGVDILLGGNADGLARDQLRKQGADLTTVEPEVWGKMLLDAQETVEVEREKVLQFGGLHVIGTERHDSRRIDNQLRGRSGRQGDPGSSRFYVSLQDDLMRRFGGQSVAGLMERFGVEEDIPLEASMVSKSIETAQTKVEGHNFDMRKHVLEYDDVVNQQREIIYAQRDRILSSTSLRENMLGMIEDQISGLVNQFTASEYEEDWDLAALYNGIRSLMPLPPPMTSESWREKEAEALTDMFVELAEEVYAEKEKRIEPEIMRQIEKTLMLDTVDRLWVHHLTALDALRQGIGLRAYGQQDPLVAYKREAHEMYGLLIDNIQQDVVSKIYHVEIAAEPTYRPKNLQATQAGSETNGPSKPNGTVHTVKRPGRNEPCWCGSGKKYKLCHMRTDSGDMGEAQEALASGQSTKLAKRKKSKQKAKNA